MKSENERSILTCGPAKRAARKRRGQAAVEFALVLTVAMIVLFVAVQMALIGQAALALGQMNYQGARYAAVHPDAGATSVPSGSTEQSIQQYMLNVGSPTITTNWASDSKNHIYVCDTDGTVSCTSTTDTAPGTPRTFGNPVTVHIDYDAGKQLVLPNPFLGITFPTTLHSNETAMSE